MLKRMLSALGLGGEPSRPTTEVAKVSMLSGDKLLLNGRETDLPGIEAEFKRLKQVKGMVWYHRENPEAKPSPKAMEVIRLVVDNALPISLSTKADFSDSVDSKGRSHPRRS